MADLEDYKYPHIEPTDYIDESLEHILARDDAAKHGFRRLSSFPSVTANDIGMKIYLVGQGNFQLISVNPEPQWKQLSDDSRNIAYIDWVMENYQPISNLLTSLAKLKEAANALPYFNGPEDLQPIPLSGYMKNLLTLTDNKEIIDALQLGSASSLDYPIDGKYIMNDSIPSGALSSELITNFGFSTGDYKFTLKTAPDQGWVMADDGSIGSATSGATNRANADTYDLFTLLWNNPYCTLQTFSGGETEKTTALEDWRSNKRLLLPKLLGRVLGVAGSGQDLTKRDLGSYTGKESTTLTAANIPPHYHYIMIMDRMSGGSGTYLTRSSNAGLGNNDYHLGLKDSSSEPTNGKTSTAKTGDGSSTESADINIIQPTSFANLMIKL